MTNQPQNVTQKLITRHLVDGIPVPGEEIGLRIEQTLTQDATGTLVMLELEAMGLDRVKTEVSVQYIDHNLLQVDNKNADDHLFLVSACQRFGIWISPPGGGVSHPVHQEQFGVPGKTLLGSDSHTCAAGAIGMLAMGAGGIEVALVMAGLPFHLVMPEVWGVRLFGNLPEWVSAKDVILEMLRRHGVQGGVGRIIEYYGPGLDGLSAMDRHVIANMGAELGATTSVFPADHEVEAFLTAHGRGDCYEQLMPDEGATYDLDEEIDLAQLEPLIAMPSSPGNVRPVREAAGEPIYQAYIGSSANPGYRDFAMAAEMVKHRQVPIPVSLDVNPTSREILRALVEDGHIDALLAAGARLHQIGCNGCIGMGQAPATGRVSLRTVPRNFPGRSGTSEDRVCLVSPETAVASAMTGHITDPRELGIPYPQIKEPAFWPAGSYRLEPPLPPEEAQHVSLVKGPNIATLPQFEPLPDELDLTVLLQVGDDLSTDEILPAGAKVLPLRSNLPAISQFAFLPVDETYAQRAAERKSQGGHAIVAGENYGQGSSREHAALAPRYLGLRMVLARSYARIHWQNLINFGVLPLIFRNGQDAQRMQRGQRIHVEHLREQITSGGEIALEVDGDAMRAEHRLSSRQIDVVLAGGLVNWTRSHCTLAAEPN